MRFLPVVVAAIAAVSGLHPQEPDAADVARRADRWFRAAEAYGFSGSVLVAMDGREVYRSGVGVGQREGSARNGPSTAYHIASLDKQFIAAGIAALVADGRLTFDDPVARWVSAARHHYGALTLHHLLSHTGGLPDAYRDGSPHLTYREFVDSMLTHHPPTSTPGARMRYSNLDYDVLTLVIEAVTGGRAEEFLAARLWKRAGMRRTGDRLVAWNADSVAYYEEPLVARSWPRVGGAMRNPLTRPDWLRDQQVLSTVEDLRRWDLSLRDDRVLPADIRDRLMTPVADDYAYGWRQAVLPDGRKILFHGGYDTGYGVATLVARDPARDWFIAILANSIASRQVTPDLLQEVALGIMLGGDLPMPPQSSATPSPDARRWVGMYQAPDSTVIRVERQGGALRLVADAPDGVAYIVFPAAMRPEAAADTGLTRLLVELRSGRGEALRERLVAHARGDAYLALLREELSRREDAYGALTAVVPAATLRKDALEERWDYLVVRFARGAMLLRRVVDRDGRWYLDDVRVGRPYEAMLAPVDHARMQTWAFSLGRGTAAALDDAGHLRLGGEDGVWLRRMMDSTAR